MPKIVHGGRLFQHGIEVDWQAKNITENYSRTPESNHVVSLRIWGHDRIKKDCKGTVVRLLKYEFEIVTSEYCFNDFKNVKNIFVDCWFRNWERTVCNVKFCIFCDFWIYRHVIIEPDVHLNAEIRFF